jgi:predicted nucleic acid-binding protein
VRIVIDTSVLVAASRSRKGASFALLTTIPSGLFQPCLSVALYVEWQQALFRPENIPQGASREIAVGFLRYLAGQSHLQEIYFLWRPFLKDPNDDMVLELAVASHSSVIVTHNVGDFVGSETFGVEILRPAEFLCRIRGER